MEITRFEEILKLGETICVEFKRCGNGIESDVYETVCSFLNRFGGDIFMDVEDRTLLLPISSELLAEQTNSVRVLRNLFKYSRYYGGGKPMFEEKDTFRISVSLDDLYNVGKHEVKVENPTINPTISELDKAIIAILEENQNATYTEIAEKLDKNRDTIASHLKDLANQRIISRVGAKKNGYWVVNKK